MGHKTVVVEHPEQHGPTAEQLKEAGVDLSKVVSSVNKSGANTEYVVEADTKSFNPGK